MKRTAEHRSAFPREWTDEDNLWSLESDNCREMFLDVADDEQEEYLSWQGVSRSSLEECGIDRYWELDHHGYWLALLQDDDMLVLAKDWAEAGKFEEEHGSECVVAVRLID